MKMPNKKVISLINKTNKIRKITVSYNPIIGNKSTIICSIDAYVLFLDFFPKDTILLQERLAALGAIKELKDRNIKIPEEFGVIGFCNDLFGEHITPGLSTIDQQTFIMGQEDFKLIYNMIKNKDYDHVKNVIIEPILIIRSSSLMKAIQT
jgi:DNA-binding LacI/PurR family transcriptional regulator